MRRIFSAVIVVFPMLPGATVAAEPAARGRTFIRALEVFDAAKTPQEEQRYLYALTGFRPAALVRQTLDRTLNGEIRTQDAPFVIRSLLTSVHGRALAWEFFKANWERMNQAFPMTGIRRMCDGVTGLATPEWERDVREFFTRNRVDLGGKTLPQILEQLHIAVLLRGREGAALHEYLRRDQ